jgi:predicted RecA/RadA family phage recombinase
MAQAIFRQGSPIMVDYTPGSAVDAGDVIVVGDNVRIAHLDIVSGRLGALGAHSGLYDIQKAANNSLGSGGEAIADGVDVYWDEGDEIATATADGNAYIGVAVGAASAAVDRVRVLHLVQVAPVESE